MARPLFLLGAVAAAAGGLYLATREKPDTASSYAWKPGKVGQNPPPPSGYKYARTVPSEVVREAKAFVSTPLGSARVLSIGGVKYILRNEWHYDDHVDGVLRWHKGISVFVRA